MLGLPSLSVRLIPAMDRVTRPGRSHKVDREGDRVTRPGRLPDLLVSGHMGTGSGQVPVMTAAFDPPFGLRFDPLPAGWTPLAGALLVKCLDEDGEATRAFRTTADMNDEELLGALTVRTELSPPGAGRLIVDPDDSDA